MIAKRFSARILGVLGGLALLSPAFGAPKLDKETCDQLKGEQAKFMESGITADIEKGAAWGKANLTADRLREVEHFILLDEQLKFGCRQVTLTSDVLKAGEEASRMEAPPQPAAPEAAGQASGQAAGKEGGGATLPGQTMPADAAELEKPAPKANPQPKPKPERRAEPAAKPAKPKAADAYQPPVRSGPPVNP